MPDPEQLARQGIDALLDQCGWTVQDKNAVNLSASRGVAVRELSFKTGEPDYTLFVDGKAIGTVAAKPGANRLPMATSRPMSQSLEKSLSKFGEVANRDTARAFSTKPVGMTADQSCISRGGFKCLPSLITTLTKRPAVIAEVERRLKLVEERQAVVNANVLRATRLRQSILERAFEGSLTLAGD